jgi:hypothetical protein
MAKTEPDAGQSARSPSESPSLALVMYIVCSSVSAKRNAGRLTHLYMSGAIPHGAAYWVSARVRRSS